MEELVRQITERTGISAPQARQAIEMVVDFAKQRLPAPVAGQLDSFLGNDSAVANASDAVQEHLGKLGGMFGNKR